MTKRQYSTVFLNTTTHLYKRSCPSVGPSVLRSVRKSVPGYFRVTNMADFDDKKSSNDVTNNDTKIDNEDVASYVSPLYLLPSKRPYSSFENNTGRTYGRTDRRTDRRTDMTSYKDAKNANLITFRLSQSFLFSVSLHLSLFLLGPGKFLNTHKQHS